MTVAHLCEQLAQCCYLKVQCVRACVHVCVCVVMIYQAMLTL